jgi:uncharacterized protein (TIGR03435 family)
MNLVTRPAAAVSAMILWVAAIGGVSTQQPATFEVASVRPSKPGETQVTVSWTGGVTMINVPLRAIVQFAYNINTPSRIVGHPDWTNVERFDIQARPPEGKSGVEQMRPMLQALLADRFKLVARSEKRELQSYALVRARPDGPLGPSLKPSTAKCTGGGVLTPAPAGASNPDAVPCGVRPGGAGRVVLIGVPMGQLAPLISLVVQRPVVDRTGIAGNFDIEMTFSPGQAPGGDLGNPDAPSIFTALEEQLGLKLDAQREMVDVLVIEKIDRPTEN